MVDRWSKTVLAAALLIAPAGCVSLAPVRVNSAGVQPSADVSELAAVLAAVRTGDGRFYPTRLAGCRGRLEAQLAKMAVTGPTATPALYPTYGSRWAYWYNARAAWSLKMALVAGCPEWVDVRTFWCKPFPLDGRMMSLDAIDEILLADARRTCDPRLAACAPGVTYAYAAPPDRPFTASDFSRGLDKQYNDLLCDGRRTVLDVEHRRLCLPVLLCRSGGVVLAAYTATYGDDGATVVTALRACAGPDARRRLADAIGYSAAANTSNELAVPKRKIFYPGKLGRVEP